MWVESCCCTCINIFFSVMNYFVGLFNSQSHSVVKINWHYCSLVFLVFWRWIKIVGPTCTLLRTLPLCLFTSYITLVQYSLSSQKEMLLILTLQFFLFCRFWWFHTASTKTNQPLGKWRNKTNVCQICANDSRNGSGLAPQFWLKVSFETAKPPIQETC